MPAYPGCPGEEAVNWVSVLLCLEVIKWNTIAEPTWQVRECESYWNCWAAVSELSNQDQCTTGVSSCLLYTAEKRTTDVTDCRILPTFHTRGEGVLESPKTRSTGTVHTSAKARITSVVIQICIRDPDRHQNLIICSLAHCQPSLQISCKSVHKFLRKVANRQTNKQRWLYILLGGGKKEKNTAPWSIW